MVQMGTNTIDPEKPDGDKPLKYPRGVFFLLFHAFCDRFDFYGIRAILTLYLTNALRRSEDEATQIYHIFLLLCCFFPLVGALIGDSRFGKFKTIFLFTTVYFMGNVLVTAAATPPLHLPQAGLTMLGLFLVSMGKAVRPCVVALSGDQYQVPQQEKQLKEYFSVFYFCITMGSLLAYLLTPILSKDVTCFEGECYCLSFSVVTVAMMTALVTFLIGKVFYRTKPTDKNIIVEVVKCMGHAAKLRCKNGRSASESHWLDHAVSSGKFQRDFVEDIKALWKLLVLYLPLPMFWALMEQQGSRWTLQANRMNGVVWGYTIKPDHMQLVNPVLVLVLIPVFDKLVYPLLHKCGLLKKPLQKLATACMLAALSFAVAGLIELKLEASSLSLPQNFSQETTESSYLETTTLFNSMEVMESINVTAMEAITEGTDMEAFVDEASSVTLVHMLWLLPQFIIITVAEVMFAVPGMEFSYSQAPESMKSVLQAVWLLTIACGNFIVAVVTKAKVVSLQSSEFFLFAVLMVVANLVFIYLANGFKGKVVDAQDGICLRGNEPDVCKAQDSVSGDRKSTSVIKNALKRIKNLFWKVSS